MRSFSVSLLHVLRIACSRAIEAPLLYKTNITQSSEQRPLHIYGFILSTHGSSLIPSTYDGSLTIALGTLREDTIMTFYLLTRLSHSTSHDQKQLFIIWGEPSFRSYSQLINHYCGYSCTGFSGSILETLDDVHPAPFSLFSTMVMHPTPIALPSWLRSTMSICISASVKIRVGLSVKALIISTTVAYALLGA